MKVLIVDGYNVIHRVPRFHSILQRSLEAARESLLCYCSTWRDTRGDFAELLVVFDGDSSVEGADHLMVRGVQVTYTRTGETADDRIRGMVDDSPSNRECVVVTDDGELAAAIRSRGGRFMSSTEFANVLGRQTRSSRCARQDENKPPLSQEDEMSINADLRRVWGGK